MKKLLYIFILLSFACKQKTQQPAVRISLTNGQKSLQVKGFDAVILGEISRDSSIEAWQSLIPVYRVPADTDLKSYQPVQPGSYQLKDSSVIFTPDTPFVKGQNYFVRSYNLSGKTLGDYVKGSTRPGQLHFTDLIFKQ